MTMYPFLSGFWISAGASTAIMFFLLYFRETRGGFTHLPPGVFTAIIATLFIAPLIGVGYAWYHFYSRRHRETTRSTQRRYFIGSIFGAIVIITAAYFLMPVVNR